MREQELKRIREYIACPQFGDENYGEWGILRLDQRKAILGLLEHINFQKIDIEYFREDNEWLAKKIADLEKEVEVHKGAMRACQVALENAHDEVVKDFACFLIDRAKDGCIQINDLPDLAVEWSRKVVQNEMCSK